jgi:16S rRNA (cytosine967-C5)-methyltransferase
VSIPEIEPFQKGWFQVQDEAAQLITCFLNPQPGEKILDACAGLGGKTFHIAQIMKNKGQIVAMDIDNRKLQEIESEKNRLGISIVSTCRHDLNEPFRKKEFNEFDRILLDAPCSGLGVLRRNPDTKWRASKRDLRRYRERQLRLLDNLAPHIKPGGIIVFAVCSTEPEENEEVVKTFLNKRSNFAIDTDYEKLSFPSDCLVDQNGFMTTFPHRHNMDGFFSVRLKRIK